MSAPGISTAASFQRPGIIHRFVTAQIDALGDLGFGGNAGSADLLEDGYALDLLGGDLSRLSSGNAPLLWMHDINLVIGRVKSIRATATALPFRAEFLKPGASQLADQKRRELKVGGAPFSVSLGFLIDDAVPISPGRPRAGMRATKWTALELSLCAIPVDPKAVVTERGRKKAMSKSNAGSTVATALDEHQAFARHHSEIADSTERLDEHRSRLGTALRGLHAAVQAGDTEAAADCHGRCMRSMRGINHELKSIGGRHQDAQDAYNAINRALRSAGDVLDLGDQDEPTAGSTEDQHGRSADYRSRQRDLKSIRSRVRESELENLRQIGTRYR